MNNNLSVDQFVREFGIGKRLEAAGMDVRQLSRRDSLSDVDVRFVIMHDLKSNELSLAPFVPLLGAQSNNISESGERDLLLSSVNIHYLIEALKLTSDPANQGRDPLFSLDPNDPLNMEGPL